MGRIADIINNSKREYHFVECTNIGGIVCPLIRMNNYDLYLYECGIHVDSYLSFFADQNINVKGIIEPGKRWRNKQSHNGTPYLIDTELNDNISNPENAFVIICSDTFYNVDQIRILNVLIKAGINKIYILSESDKTQVTATSTPSERENFWYYKENIRQLETTYDLLYDEQSRLIMEEYISVFCNQKKYKLSQSDTRNKYFYGGVTIDERENIYTHLDNEVWINCGANVGDTVFLYFDAGLKAKKVYAFEGDSENYKALKSGIALLPEQYKSIVKPVRKYIDITTDFEKYIDEPVTLINADIQGNELVMLQGLKNIIVNDRPVISICVYHRASDLVEIPYFLSHCADNYKYVLRKYAANALSSTDAWELVLYAIPEERCCITP